MINLILIGINAISLYLMIILISFDPADPGWMQSTWNGSICNIGGITGARISDFLFFYFGGLAYIMPLFILFYFRRILLSNVNISISFFCLKSTGILIFLFICCGLAQLIIDDIFYFSPGGIVGNILFDLLKTDHYRILDIILMLLFIGIISFIYFFHNIFLRFIKIVEKKIARTRHIIFILFLKNKNNSRSHAHQKVYFNSRIYPSVFLVQDETFFKKKSCNSLEINKNLNKYENKIIEFSNRFNFPRSKNNSTKIKYIPSMYKISNQNYGVIKCWMTRFRLNIDYINYDRYNMELIDKTRFQSKNNLNITNQHTNSIHSNIIIPNISHKKLYKNNKLLTHSIHNISCVNSDNSSKKRELISINHNINQYSSIPKMNDTDMSIISQEQYNNNDNNNRPSFPNTNLLMTNSKENIIDYTKLKKIAVLIEKKLLEYRIVANVAKIVPGPVITRFELSLSAGIKSSKISNLSRDLARSLSIASVRVVEVIPGTPYVGLEIPNEKRNIVYLRDIINSKKFQKINSPLALVFGRDISGEPIIEDLRCMPHLLVSGTTGSGKSVGINAMIISILYKATPEDVRFIMIDPKILELSIYSNVPHLLKKVITNTKDAESILQWCVKEMEHRYKLMSVLGVRNLESYNHRIEQLIFKQNKSNYSTDLVKQHTNNNIIYYSQKFKKLPYIIVIIDEFSDLMIMTAKTVEILIVRLTQKARAAGIHLILSTQRPSVDVITGLIKSNIPARIAFTVSSKIDSRTILGQSGAESLLGMGDMLYLPPNSSMLIRIHGVLIKDQEIHEVVNFWKNQAG